MSKASQWREIFRYREKEKVTVRVGETLEEMTHTQAHRFEELSNLAKRDSQGRPGRPPLDTTYTLAEAAVRLNISDDRLLQKAASGRINLYVNAAGLKGCWRRGMSGDDFDQLSVQTLRSGYLSLATGRCPDIAEYETISVSRLELRGPLGFSSVELGRDIIEVMSSWGDHERIFFLVQPLCVDRNQILVVPPIPDLRTDK